MKTNLPLHVEAPQFDVKDNCLSFGGRKVRELSQSMGGKPFYVYDKGAIEERISYLRKNIPSDISLHYAVKANPMPAVVEFISDRVDGLDVVSGDQSDCGLIVVEREMLRVGDLDLLALVDRIGHTGVASV